MTKLLESANLKDAQIAQAEKDMLEAQDLTPEEVAERRTELRHQRELLFREESRRKRIAKIKSKTFRKIARKRAGKGEGELDLEQLRALDPERAEEEQIKLEAARAKERATLKHSAKGGRWAQSQQGAGEYQGKRQELEDMLAQKDRLQRKIQGRDSDDESSMGDVSGDDDDDLEDVDPRTQAFDELESLRARQAALDQEVSETKAGGIYSMKFMQNAALKEKAMVDAAEDQLRRELEEYEDGGIRDSDDGSSEEDDTGVQRVGGRIVLTGSGAVGMAGPTMPKTTESAVPALVNTESTAQSSKPAKSQAAATLVSAATTPEENPWANLGTESVGRSRKNNVVRTGKEATQADRAMEALKKQKTTKTDAARERLAHDAEVDITIDQLPTSRRANGSVSKNLPLRDASDDDEDAQDGDTSKGLKAFTQRDLVASAFAGDNVIQVSLDSFSCSENNVAIQTDMS